MNTSRHTTEPEVGVRQDHAHTRQEIDAALMRILDALDATGERLRQASAAPTGDRRKHPRYPFRILRFTIDVELSNQPRKIQTCTRNLSAGGMAFITNAKLEIGTPCRAALPKLDGTTQQVTGDVILCRAISPKYFEAGIQFTTEIQPFDFVDAGAAAAG